MKVFSIDAGYFKLDGGAMFGVVPRSIWEKLNPPDEKNLCTWAMRCLLVDEGERKILIDTGMGNKQSEKFFGHYQPHGDGDLLRSLKAHGYEPEEITDVLLTHLHFDHCGGAVSIKDGIPVNTFPNALYWTTEAHWKWAIEPNAREKASFLKENILPLQESGKLRFVDETPGNRTRFSENISIHFANGHTRSMMIPMVAFKGKTICYMADLIPSAAHIALPYVMAYDMFPMTTLEEKSAFLNEAAENGYMLFFEHDPKTTACTVQKTEKGFSKKEELGIDLI